MKKGITAADLMAKLNADPEFVAKRAKEDEERAQRAAELRKAEAPLVEELRSVGFGVESVWDLVNTKDRYAAAVPILLKHLPRSYPGPVRDGIARALAVPEAQDAWRTIKELYERETDSRAKDGLAVALAATTSDEVIDQLISIVRDRRHGPSRILLLSALERAKSRAALMELGIDPELQQEIQVILKRLRRRGSNSGSQ